MSEFGVIDLEEIQGDAARLNSSENQENYLDQFLVIPDPKPGQTLTYNVRILPPRKGAKLFQYTRLHLINGRKYQCPRPLVNGKWDWKTPCPICDYYNSLYRQRDKLEKAGRQAEAEKFEEEARSIKPIERYYYNAIARSHVNEKGEVVVNAGPKIWSVGKVLHKIIVKSIVGGDGDAPLGDVTNVKTGYDFIVKKEMRGTGKDAYPNYDRSSFARESSVAGTADEIKKWVDSLHDLTVNRKPTEFDVLDRQLAIYRGLIPDDADGFDVEKFDERWKSQGSAQAKKASASVPAGVPGKTPDVDDMVTSAPSSEEMNEVQPENMNIEDPEFFEKMNELKID